MDSRAARAWSGLIGFVGSTAAALGQPGSIVGWGLNGTGPAAPQNGLFVAAAGNDLHSAAIRSDGTLFQWGEFPQWPVPQGTFTAVDGSRLHFIALRTDRTLAHWGFSETPIYSLPTGTFRTISTGLDHALAIRTDGSLVQWGAPVGSLPTGNDFVAVAAGENPFSFALRADGTIEAWGSQFMEQFGVYSVPPGTYTQVVAGQRFGAALRADGIVVAWGEAYGNLSLLTGNFTQIRATDYTIIGLRSDGTLAHSTVSPAVPVGTYGAIGAGSVHGLAIVPATPSFLIVAVGAALAARRRRRSS